MASTTLEFTVPVTALAVDVVTDLGLVEAHVAGTHPGGGGYSISQVNFVGHAAQAAQGGTNACTGTLQYVRAAGAPVVIGSINFGTVAVVADVPLVITPAAGTLLLDGDVLQWATTHIGTGGTTTAASLEIELSD